MRHTSSDRDASNSARPAVLRASDAFPRSRSLRLRVFAAAVLMAACSPVHQTSAQSTRVASFDFGIGTGRAITNTRFHGDASGLSLDALVSTRDAVNQNARILALALGLQATGPRTAVCFDDGNGGCIPGYPEVYSVSALIGWQSDSGVIRLLAGPSLAYLDNSAVGAHIRLDVTMPVTERFAFVSYARAQSYAVSGASPYNLLGVGLGIRFSAARAPQHQSPVNAAPDH